MLAQNKAKQIIDKFKTNVVMWTGGVVVENENVKQCSLIVVNEIIDSQPKLHNGYWEEVKQEIENYEY